MKYYDRPDLTLDRMAFSLTGDAGCEYGGGVSCYGDKAGGPKQSFLGFMLYNRLLVPSRFVRRDAGRREDQQSGTLSGVAAADQWRERDHGGYKFSLLYGESRRSVQGLGSSITFDYMPKQYITFRWEYDYRHANVPYWSVAAAALRLRAAILEHRRITFATTASPPARRHWGPRRLSAPARRKTPACGFRILRRDENFIDMSILVKF